MTTDYPVQRPPSDQLVDLHVYLLPREVWSEKFHSAYTESISEAVSAGYVRVSPDQTVSDLRMVIEEQLGPGTLPPNYVFLRSVGRCMTQVRPKQELVLKCKAFLPPEAWAPEIVVLEPQIDSMGYPTFQSYPDGYTPRHDATQPPNGIPTHFPQIANHDRMAPPIDAGLDEGTKITLETNQEKAQNKSSLDRTMVAKSKDRNVAKEGKPTAKKGSKARPVLGSKEMANTKAPQTKAGLGRIKRLKQTQATWSKEAKQAKIAKPQEPKKEILGSIRDKSVRGRKIETGLGNEKTLARGKGQKDARKNTYSGQKIGRKVEPVAMGTTPRHKGRVVDVPPVIKVDRLGKLQDRTAQTSGIYIGQSPIAVQQQHQQQQQGYKGDPLHSMTGTPGKSGRPDAYTNNTNEDSGIAEPTPDDDDPAYERRKSDMDDQYYSQLDAGQTNDGQFHHGERRLDHLERSFQEKELEEERQRQAALQQREEEKREEERRATERQNVEKRRKAERQREEERREHKRKMEEDAKERRQREEEKRMEEELRKKEEKMKEEIARKEEENRLLEEQLQQKITDRSSAADFDGAVPLDEGDSDYNDAAVAMETSQAPDGLGQFINDEQMRRRAEDELQDYEPQSTWKLEDDGDRETGHLAHPSSRIRSREDTEMEIASHQAVQDGLKKVHLTPERHRKAKIGKKRDSSITDEEDVYETDPEMAGLLEQLQIARQERMKKEKERENLIKRAKDLQTKTYERRNRSRDYWKKRYYDEKKKTAPLEEQGVRIRNQLDVMHRKLLSHIEGKKKGVSVKGPPSKKNDHKINILKMQHELDEIRRKVDNSRMKLTSEIKLRNQAEEEVRGLKNEVTQRKINMTLIRNQKLAALKTGENKLLSKTPIPALGQGPISMSAKR